MTYTIGEMAQYLGVAPSTLRYYDQAGLLPFVERSAMGSRLFSDKDFEWLRIIGCLKKTGLSIKDIRTYVDLALIGDSTIKARGELLSKQRENVIAQIKELEAMKKILDYKCWIYETAEKCGTTAVPRNLSDEEIPAEFRAIRQKLLAVPTKRQIGQSS